MILSRIIAPSRGGAKAASFEARLGGSKTRVNALVGAHLRMTGIPHPNLSRRREGKMASPVVTFFLTFVTDYATVPYPARPRALSRSESESGAGCGARAPALPAAPGQLRASCWPALGPVREVLSLDWDRRARLTTASVLLAHDLVGKP